MTRFHSPGVKLVISELILCVENNSRARDIAQQIELAFPTPDLGSIPSILYGPQELPGEIPE